ncbi:Lar family restriction alleviation protein [Pseudomonas typographi]|uniref:Lar family restriction alleviation protein n=1 Tax=Pseudomonas typographi TaxID=2715964 RepID=UPI0016870D4D|nr:Lar family restriction alleviation protein [Pseudomonas typographi]MBD1553852.1 restriction alleviation protein, Lar family [Pseudomonas typographi]
MTNEQKLLPCPFCGSESVQQDVGGCYLSCNSCGAEGPMCQGEQTPLDSWNTRAALAEDVRAAGDEPVGYELTMNGEQKDLAAAKFGAPTPWENLQRHGYVISPLYRHPQRPVVLPERLTMKPFQTVDRGSTSYKAGYNACLDEISRLNP